MNISYHQFKSQNKAYRPQNQAQSRSLANKALVTPSSSKRDHGPECLTDGSKETYWQSTDSAPHHLLITLPRQTCVNRMEIEVNAGLDETFVPKEIAVYAGTGAHDLFKVGIENIPSKTGTYCLYFTEQKRPLGVFELVILSNNDFGRDSRIRKLEIYAEKGEDQIQQVKPERISSIPRWIYNGR